MNREHAAPERICVWTDLPEFQRLPVSAFDRDHRCPEALLRFRTEFRSRTGKIRLRFSGGCRFRLFLNGKFLEDGPVETGGDYGNTTPPDWAFYDEILLEGLPERNQVEFEVFPAGITQTDYSDGSGWIFLETEEEKGVVTRFPAGKWRCSRDFSWTSNRCFNAVAARPEQWKPCVPAASRFPLKLDLPRLTNDFRPPAKIRFPYGRGRIEIGEDGVITVPPEKTRAFYLEFDREVSAHFQMVLEGAEYASVQLDFREEFGVPGETYRYVLDGGPPRVFRTVKMYAFRWVMILVTPADFSSPEPEKPCRISGAGAFLRNFPLGEPVPLPENTPEWLRTVDGQGLANLRLCMQRLHLDSPIHQEGLGCTGDYRIDARIEYAAFGETRLAKADLFRTALLLRQSGGKLFHRSFELCYVMMLAEYASFSGDLEFARELFDTVELVLARWKTFVGPEGLVSEADTYLFIDWKAENGSLLHHPPAERGMGPFTAFYAGALEKAEFLARLLGRNAFAEELRKERSVAVRSFQTLLADPVRGLYRDGIPHLTRVAPNRWLPADSGRVSVTSQTNILALACGMVPDADSAAEIAEKLMTEKDLLQPTPYFLEYFFEGLDRYGLREKHLPALLKRWKAFGREGLRETWLAGDYSHAWGAAPSWVLRARNDLFQRRPADGADQMVLRHDRDSGKDL